MATELEEEFENGEEFETEEAIEDDAEDIDETDDASGQDEEQTDGEEARQTEVVESKPNRREARFQKLRNENKRIEEEFSKYRRETEARFSQLTSRQEAPVPKEPSADEMALWSAEQIIDYKLNKATSNFNQTLQKMQWDNFETNDRAKFEQLKLTDPRAKKYAAEVENRLADLRRSGNNVEREVLLKYILGEKVLSNAAKATSKQKVAGETRIRRQQAAAPQSRSDVVGGRQKKTEAEARIKRLENVVF